MENKQLDSVQKDIKRYFGFLFDKGYKIRDAVYDSQHFGNWIVALESPNCVIEITNDRNEILLAFAPVKSGRNNQIGLRPMIYFLSHEQNFIGPYEGNLFWGRKKQFERLASLLKEYIDQITPYFGNDFEKYKSDLMSAGKKYVDLSIERYARKMRGPK
jgi:hypothetical protein